MADNSWCITTAFQFGSYLSLGKKTTQALLCKAHARVITTNISNNKHGIFPAIHRTNTMLPTLPCGSEEFTSKQLVLSKFLQGHRRTFASVQDQAVLVAQS